ncbi:ANTAR domain-containing protein [Nonomuraea solani]|uniref:ANTAR domain-containing protein n=1 Tax=Nonomuraea solani TaxID=1144553 RepID=UPI0011B0E0C2|nr:ANTAR domain-containing protein [Nonomuraea solani]
MLGACSYAPSTRRPLGALRSTAEIHQAGQLGCPPDQALSRLRAHVSADDEPLSQVARRVPAHTLRFSREPWLAQ